MVMEPANVQVNNKTNDYINYGFIRHYAFPRRHG